MRGAGLSTVLPSMSGAQPSVADGESKHRHLNGVGTILPHTELVVLLSRKYLKIMTKCLLKDKAPSGWLKEIK